MLSEKPFEIPTFLFEKCRHLPALPIAVIGADNMVALESAKSAAESGLANPTLIGDADEIRSLAHVIDWDISLYEIIDADTETAEVAAGVALARNGKVKALMKGHVHTDVLMRGVVARDSGLRAGRRLSHVFHMTVPDSDRVLLITDGAVNIHPDIETKKDIILNAVDLAHGLGNPEPHVALLSGTESVLPAMPSSVEAAEIVKWARNGGVSGAIVDGPFAFDNAISPQAASMKGIDSPVAGNADILVVPNIETGNSLFKMMVYFMSGLAAGVVVGARVPIVLTSRADPPEARFAATAIATIFAA